MGLQAALVDLVDRVTSSHGIKGGCRETGEPLSLPEEIAIFAYRAVQELLMNAMKHAVPSGVTVAVAHEGAFARITVSDDGAGFKEDTKLQTVDDKEGFGLLSIRERLDDIGGCLEIASQPGHGAQVALLIPLAGPEHSGTRSRRGMKA